MWTVNWILEVMEDIEIEVRSPGSIQWESKLEGLCPRTELQLPYLSQRRRKMAVALPSVS